jgi:hypothetical protein
MIVVHVNRALGTQLPLHDGDTVKVLDGQLFVIAELSGELVRSLIEHHLAGVALQAAIGREVRQSTPTPYRKALAWLPFSAVQRAQHARKRKERRHDPKPVGARPLGAPRRPRLRPGEPG